MNTIDQQPHRHTTHIRTFQPRRGRFGRRHEDALARFSQKYGVSLTGPLDPASLFGRRAPLVLEIGSGMGDSTAEMAAADPDRDYLAVEVHPPGIANLFRLTSDLGLTNIRVADADAIELVRQLPGDSIDALHIFFPDPWPKSKHHKRRLIQPDHVALLRSRLAPGGVLHCATDWAEYAHSMLETLSGDPELVNDFDGYAPRPQHRPRTKFEQRGIDSGREIFDLIFRRRVL